MMQKFFVSVFVKDKYVNSYFSENLDDLVTIKALHKDCEIFIFDLEDFVLFAKEQVEKEISKSGLRWKESVNTSTYCDSSSEKVVKKKQKKGKTKKYWNVPVVCIETGQVFCSIRECCERLGLSHKSVWNSINSGNARNGLHFAKVQKAEGENPDS